MDIFIFCIDTLPNYRKSKYLRILVLYFTEKYFNNFTIQNPNYLNLLIKWKHSSYGLVLCF